MRFEAIWWMLEVRAQSTSALPLTWLKNIFSSNSPIDQRISLLISSSFQNNEWSHYTRIFREIEEVFWNNSWPCSIEIAKWKMETRHEKISAWEFGFLSAVAISSLLLSLGQEWPLKFVLTKALRQQNFPAREKGYRAANSMALVSYKDNNKMCGCVPCPICMPLACQQQFYRVTDPSDPSTQFSQIPSSGQFWTLYRTLMLAFWIFFISLFVWTSDNDRVTRILEERRGVIGLIAWASRPFFNFGEWLNIVCKLLLILCMVTLLKKYSKTRNADPILQGFNPNINANECIPFGPPNICTQQPIGFSQISTNPNNDFTFIPKASTPANGGLPVDPDMFPMPINPWCNPQESQSLPSQPQNFYVDLSKRSLY